MSSTYLTIVISILNICYQHTWQLSSTYLTIVINILKNCHHQNHNVTYTIPIQHIKPLHQEIKYWWRRWIHFQCVWIFMWEIRHWTSKLYPLIHLNIMALLKETQWVYWTWQEVCSRLGKCQTTFWEKRQQLFYISSMNTQ